MLRQIRTPLVLLGVSMLGFVALISANIGLAIEKGYWPAVRSDVRALLQIAIIVALGWVYHLLRSARRPVAEADTVQMPRVRITGTVVGRAPVVAAPTPARAVKADQIDPSTMRLLRRIDDEMTWRSDDER